MHAATAVAGSASFLRARIKAEVEPPRLNKWRRDKRFNVFYSLLVDAPTVLVSFFGSCAEASFGMASLASFCGSVDFFGWVLKSVSYHPVPFNRNPAAETSLRKEWV